MTNCPICGKDADLHTTEDLNKTCNPKLFTPPPAGVTVEYYRCSWCRHIFTRFFDNWTPEQFSKHIYNEDYYKIDPDSVCRRAQGLAPILAKWLSRAETILDYGGGTGVLAERLRNGLPGKGFNAVSWDKFKDQPRPKGPFDVLLAIEVLEHVVNPLETMQDIKAFMKPFSRLVFSTVVSDDLKPQEKHWYISPRNGHIHMYSSESLRYVAASIGKRVSAWTNLHLYEMR